MPDTKTQPKRGLSKIFEDFDNASAGFDAKTQRILQLVMRLVQNNKEATARAEAKADAALRAISEKHNISLTELKKQTNQLFVGERLDEITEGNTAQFEGLQSLLDEKGIAIDDKLLTVKDGDTPTDDQLLALMLPLIPKSPDLTKLKQAIVKILEDHKELKRKINSFSRSGGGSRFLGGPNANAVLSHDASDQCNGENKTFNMPMARRVNAVRCTQFPFFYRPTIDFTIGDREIVLTDEVAAPESGQSLFIDYVR